MSTVVALVSVYVTYMLSCMAIVLCAYLYHSYTTQTVHGTRVMLLSMVLTLVVLGSACGRPTPMASSSAPAPTVSTPTNGTPEYLRPRVWSMGMQDAGVRAWVDEYKAQYPTLMDVQWADMDGAAGPMLYPVGGYSPPGGVVYVDTWCADGWCMQNNAPGGDPQWWVAHEWAHQELHSRYATDPRVHVHGENWANFGACALTGRPAPTTDPANGYIECTAEGIALYKEVVGIP